MSIQSTSTPRAENWENEGGSVRPADPAESFGVTTFLTEHYVVGGYKYTNLADAIAQGQRMQKGKAS
jgi:hypothetical protein